GILPHADVPPRLFALNETVYSRHELETTDNKRVPTGTRGKVVQLYHHNTKHGWSCDVDFDGIGIGWCFERELTPLEPILDIEITRGAVVPPGAALPPIDSEIKHQLIKSGLQPAPLDSSPIVSENDVEASATPDEERTPAIRII